APENARMPDTPLPVPGGQSPARPPVAALDAIPADLPLAHTAADDTFARYLSGTVHLASSAPHAAPSPAAHSSAVIELPAAPPTTPEPAEGVEPAPLHETRSIPAWGVVTEAPEIEYYQEARPTLQMRVMRWLRLQPPPAPQPPNRVRDRRRAHRLNHPDLIAYFFTGGAPHPHRIENISVSGFLMHCEDMWMPDTMIRMTLQKVGTRGDRRGDSVTVLTRMVRRVGGGSAFEFVFGGVLD
ncbi:MAG TPA: hypothetical protein VN151_01390, partial [Terracidiphilus sp.]|nr:hypothetical protein [Terracidiphilus sp.]